ncbi:hypothetical protein Cgig2_023669 [Carnegiea gigantea]|uniref:Protein kinase domain-containing protein n=1 Tax=Carnegiea gigantea TaxID=171969 RepID=A0A9Q1KKS0_9CARY|nr:hypothetical protein Cgig2_023669 [Carnegiea gigantea]
MKDKDPSSLSRRKHPSIKKLKLICSFNGRFRRRSVDGELRYTGGETRIIAVDPTTLTLSRLRLTIIQVFRPENSGFSLKYQLPGSDSDCPLVLIASDDDVRCMVEEYESIESYGKPFRLWLFVCNGSDDYVHDDDDNDDKDDGNSIDVGEHDVDLGSGVGVFKGNLAFRGEKLGGSVKGCGNVASSGVWKGSIGRNGVNGRRVSDNSLRKLVLKQQLLARQQGQVKKCDESLVNLGLEQNDDHPLNDLGTVILDAKTGNDVDSSGLGYGIFVPCNAQLPSDQNQGGLGPTPTPHARPLNPRDDNLLEIESQPMEPSMVCCDQGMVSGSIMKQQLGFSERVSLEYLNRENILPSSQDWDVLNSHSSCGNHVSRSSSMHKSFHRGHGMLGHQCSVGNHQFSLNDLRGQRVVCPSYNKSYRMVRVDGKNSAPARCHPGIGAFTTISKQCHSAMELDCPNLSRPFSGQHEYNSVQTRTVISPIWNDWASSQPNRATIKKHGQVYDDVDIHSPQVVEDLLIDFSDEPSGNRYNVNYEQWNKTTIKCQSHSNDANFSVVDVGSGNVEQAPGFVSNAANPTGMLMHKEGVSELTGSYHHGFHPVPHVGACSVDVSSYKDSHASNEICEELKMARLKLLDLMAEAKGPAEVKGSHDIVAEASAEDMQDHSHARQSLNDNVGTDGNKKHSSVCNGIGSDFASFYACLTPGELQAIKDSDLEYIKELGSGNYGTVYYGKWKGSDVAIKKIKPSCFSGYAMEDDQLVADFWKEARMLAQLHHPNIVAFYGIVSDGPITNLATVTEYMINGSLKQVLQRKDRTIDRRKRLAIAMDAAFGMEYLHEKNIVHFDLKSQNFLVNMRDPQRPVCKIGDLGLSKIKQRTLVSGGFRGTIPWMAPELLNTTSNLVMEMVDVYSFGIVMWELLTGEDPYANMRSQEILDGIIEGTLRPEIPSWCDPVWRSLMERCWSSDPKSRPSFSEVARELCAMSAAMNIK